ncbi:hypothetical protein FEM48_Zijuj01G0288700 [Ziziphus jujuba var. spinosa]|uniref:Uncharacterized protein n=1 Tax=Ziziphus jujuba var. spinosa TaxID=714518 RepID=A0A978W5K6_ZIZJJ|nr:hypothetical protein FEM48_Zijuj01G0288700 [Ziziphus jujuba var. spinosa]
MDSQTQNTSLQRLQNVEKGFGAGWRSHGRAFKSQRPQKGVRQQSLREFMQLIKMWSNGNHTVNNVERLEFCLIIWYCWIVSSICPDQLRVYHDEALKLGHKLSSAFGSLFLYWKVKSSNLLNQDIQVSLQEEIKSACDYWPFEKCDYSSRIANEICCKKLEYVKISDQENLWKELILCLVDATSLWKMRLQVHKEVAKNVFF